MTTEIAVQTDAPLPAMFGPSPMLDPQRFQQMAAVATMMAKATLIPEHLQVKDERGLVNLERTAGNCLMIVNQAYNWDADPMAVAQATALVHGRLCYEGKLVAAVVERKLGVRLKYEWFGEPKDGDAYRIRVSHPDKPEEYIEGSVGDWKTFEKGGGLKTLWQPSHARLQLKYRGDREWARAWAPGIMLGVYTPDEFNDAANDYRAARAVPVGTGLASRLSGGGSQGFSAASVAEQIDAQPGDVIEVSTGEQSGAAVTQMPTGRKATDTNTSVAPASEKPSSTVGSSASRDDGGSGSASSNQTTNSDAAATASDERGQGSQAAPIPGEQTSSSHAPLSRDVFRRYVKAIGRAKKEDSVAAYTKQFLTAEKINAFSEAEKKLFAQLRDEYVRCVLHGSVTIEQYLAETEGWIVTDVAEDML